jgi:LPPG:FO 2-phospho-L-lactate transferase
MTDHTVATHITTPEREMHFQEYWITYGGAPDVLGVNIHGIDDAAPSDTVLSALDSDDSVIIGPSNPITSIGPILKPVSGPAGRLMRACGYEVSSAGVLECYRDLLGDLPDVFVIDDADIEIGIETGGVEIVHADTMMTSVDKSEALSRLVVNSFRNLPVQVHTQATCGS